MAELLLESRNMTVGYSGVPAVNDLSISVGAGEVLALLGPNGAGKSTCLSALVGLLPLMSGDVHAFGHRVGHGTADAQARRGMVLVPDDRGVFPGLTVSDHLALAQRRGGAFGVEDLFDLFPALPALRSRRVGLLSGGEQQMLAVGKAMLMGPRVLLIDELSLGLAPIIVQNLLGIISRLPRETGIGVVLVEQHVSLALKIADKAVVLNRGHVVLTGSGRELLEDQKSLEAAYFN